MNIAIIGGGFTGLTAAYEFAKLGHAVTVFEKEKELGGLAVGFKGKDWEWSIEKGYHHLFTNDSAIIGLLSELGISDKLIIKRPVTANYFNGRIIQFDRPGDLLNYPAFSLRDKVRTAALLAFLKINPFWKPLEGLTAKKLFETVGGKGAWVNLWELLMVGKFGSLADTVAASWLWARIKKRTTSLAYIEGGFQTLVDALEDKIRAYGGTIYSNTSIIRIIEVSQGKLELTIQGKSHKLVFDKVLLTVPTAAAVKLVPQLTTYNLPLTTIPHLHAQTLILETKEPILENVYWLNILDRTFPFLCVVAHTNFMDKKHYGGHHLTYFGNYLPTGHTYLSMTKEQLLKEFMPFIKRLCPSMNHERITNNYIFVGPFAQPVHQLHYSRLAPKLETPIKGLFIANLDSIYPWDRGTNYAVELGKKAARTIIDN